MGVAETTYFLSQCVIRGTDRQLIMSLFLDCSPLQQRCTVTGRKPCCVWRRLPYRRLVRALFDRLQYEGGGRGVTLLEQDLVEPLQLGLICKTTEQDNTLQWGCKCAVKGSVRFIYVCVCVYSLWTEQTRLIALMCDPYSCSLDWRVEWKSMMICMWMDPRAASARGEEGRRSGVGPLFVCILNISLSTSFCH